jgi:hypothetical protein
VTYRTPFLHSVGCLFAVVAATGTFVSCSNKNEEIKLTENLKTVIESNNANSVTKTGEAAFGLLSPLPFKTYLNSFVSQVRGSSDSQYRYTLMDGFSQSCNNWGEFRSIAEPLKLALGQEGPKTLCLQNKDKNGTLGSPLTISFRKSLIPENGPAYTLTSNPPSITYNKDFSISIDSQEVSHYRAVVKAGDTCGTLENESWKSVGEKIVASPTYDGDWVLCLDVRDKFGNKSRTPHAHVWTLDREGPVMDPLVLPEGDTLPDALSFDVKGNFVQYYKSALVENESECPETTPYSNWVERSQRLSVSLPPQDGTWTLCVLTAKGNNANSIQNSDIQKKPFLLPIKKSSLRATVEILPVPVIKESSGNIRFVKQERLFKMGGANITHYKARTMNYSDNDCSQWDVPDSEPIPVATPLSWTISDEATGTNAIKTLCVWGLRNIDSAWLVQQKATHVRFYNDTNSTTRIPDDPTLPAFTISQAVATCSCHDAYTAADFANNAVRISTTLRTNQPKPMPVGGWRSEEQRRGMLKFLYNLPGYPQDLPQVLQAQ